jgi:5-methylcytosine-specific restriction endonuclease McrA
MTISCDLPAAQVDQRLRQAVRELERAEHHAVLLFAELSRRRLYRDLGFSSMRQYAITALGFSSSRAADFIRLAARLDELPRVRDSVARGQLGYTKAREIIKVASPGTEQRWLEEAEQSSRRELEQKVRKTRERAKQRRSAKVDQAELVPAATVEPSLADAAPTSVSIRMTAEQRARYDALWQTLGRAPNAEDLLEALAVLAGTKTSASESNQASSIDVPPRGETPTIQVHVHECPECGATTTNGRPLDRADRERLRCDAAIARPGERNTTIIPPRVRREVLARDRHRCRAPGCDHTMFLDLHHVVPRAQGGTNDPANLITLCSACHRLWHERGRPGWFMGVAAADHVRQEHASYWVRLPLTDHKPDIAALGAPR